MNTKSQLASFQAFSFTLRAKLSKIIFSSRHIFQINNLLCYIPFPQISQMGCEDSHLASQTNSDQDIPSMSLNNGKKKKNQHERLHGRSPTEKIFENVKKLDKGKTPEDLEFIQKTISKHFLLFKLSKHERREIANAMYAYETQVDSYVFQQGTPGSMFFIIQEGEVQIEISGSAVKGLKKGDFFGELALLFSAPRSASVKVVQKCVFWCLSQHIFHKIQREMVKNNYRVAKPFVNKLPLFGFLSNKQRDAISYNMNTLKYQENQAIFKEGDDAASFYIIISGLIEIQISDKNPIKFKNGDSFGENCLKPNQLRSGTALCVEKTQLLAMSRQDLKSCLGDKSIEELLYHNIVKWSLRRSQIFSNSAAIDECKLVSLGQFAFVDDEEIICQQQIQDNKIYICLEGKINEYSVGKVINQSEALEQNANIFTSKQKLVKKQSGYVFMIHVKYIQKQKNKERKKNMDTLKKFQTKQEIIKTPRSSSINNFKVDLKDLYVMCKLGEGQMGKVYLVQNKKTQQLYALKCVEKNIVLKHEMQKFVKAQKQILQNVDCPFIVKMYETYKDSHFIYFLLKYIEGGDFFDFLSEIGICNSTTAQFYFSCLFIAIEYLHKSSIVYRDLKPQNAVVDANGYLHMIDLGTAKILTEDSENGFRTFTIIGTPHYMAPEVMEAKGYSFSVDIWSLGVILYEMLCGVLPYGGYSDDPVNIYKQIEKNQLRFPKNYSDPSGKQLIHRLLQKHPEKRAVHSFTEIKGFQFFKNFNWSLLESQKMDAPIKPKNHSSKWNSKSQYLLSYLQKQKLKMEKPLSAKNSSWDQMF